MFLICVYPRRSAANILLSLAAPMMRSIPRCPVKRRRLHARTLHHVVNIGVTVIETAGAHSVVVVPAAGVTGAGVDLLLKLFQLLRSCIFDLLALAAIGGVVGVLIGNGLLVGGMGLYRMNPNGHARLRLYITVVPYPCGNAQQSERGKACMIEPVKRTATDTRESGCLRARLRHSGRPARCGGLSVAHVQQSNCANAEHRVSQ